MIFRLRMSVTAGVSGISLLSDSILRLRLKTGRQFPVKLHGDEDEEC